MKKIICCLILIMVGFQSFSQVPLSSAGSKEYYQQKSKNQKKTAWILLAAGTAMVVGGGIGFNNNWELFENNSKADVYGAIMVGGIVADLVSISLFISSARNARRAVKLGVSSQLNDLPQGNNVYIKPYPAISVKIPF